MNIVLTRCRACGHSLEVPVAGAENEQRCTSCASTNVLYPFPVLWAGEVAGSVGERVVLDDESACFYHPEKRAAVVCEGCGRFLCSLCDISFKGKHLCTACIERGTQSGEDTFRQEYTRYDKVALVLAAVPLLVFYFTLITAPIALYLCIRHRKTPLSPVPVSRWRFHVAAVLAMLQIVGWLAGFALLTGAFVFDA